MWCVHACSIALTIPTAAAYMYSGVVGAKPLGNLSHATAIILAFTCAAASLDSCLHTRPKLGPVWVSCIRRKW